MTYRLPSLLVMTACLENNVVLVRASGRANLWYTIPIIHVSNMADMMH